MFVPIFQVRQPRLGAGKSLAQRHTARNLNPHQVLNLPSRLSTEIKAIGPVPPSVCLGCIVAPKLGVLVPKGSAHSHESTGRMSSALPPSSLQRGRPSTQSLSGQSWWEQDVPVLLPWPGPVSYFGARLLMGHGCPAGLLISEAQPQAGLARLYPCTPCRGAASIHVLSRPQTQGAA